MAEQLTLKMLSDAVAGSGCAFRSCVKLEPAGGEGTKVFPPTYAGAVYATEKRRLKGHEEPVECVLLDSVQSQANRMEEALQQAVDAKRIKLPIVKVDFDPYFPGESQPESMRLLDRVGKVGSLQVPHRIADAILRESLLEGKPFRESEIGKRIGMVSARDATALFELCPTALVFGMWDSTGPKGGLGAKFERAIVSEIVGIDAVYGVKTSGRIDPLILKNPSLFETPEGDWTVLESEAARVPLQAKKDKGTEQAAGESPADHQESAKTDKKNAPKKYPKKLSELNLGSVTPDLDRYSDKSITKENRKTRDPMRDDGEYIESGRIAPGGVTITHAEQTVVLSLPALRRLRFPLNGKHDIDIDIDNAARTVLAALGLCAAALSAENGLDLRSRCLLWPNEPLEWELLAGPGEVTKVGLGAKQAVKLLQEAVAAAKKLGLTWREEPLVLTPSPKLVKLVVESQKQAAKQGGKSAEGDE